LKIIEIQLEDSYIDNVINILQSLKKEMIQKISIKETPSDNKPFKKNLNEFAGMWSDREVDIDTIREKAWKKSS